MNLRSSRVARAACAALLVLAIGVCRAAAADPMTIRCAKCLVYPHLESVQATDDVISAIIPPRAK